MSGNGCSNTLLGNLNKDFLTVYNGSLVAKSGCEMELDMPFNLFAPYEQLLRGKVTLKPGQCKYLLNHLGLGDNATFLYIRANYELKSVIEAENFVQYSYYTDPNNWLSFAQMMILTGNSENRIEQLYLTNPNKDYKVTLDIVVGIIDDNNDFYSNICDCDDIASNGIIKFTGLVCEDIITWVPGETIAILDPTNTPQIYINLSDINSISKSGKVITINDRSTGTILLEFTTLDEAKAAFNKLSIILENNDTILQDLDCNDDEPPCITFTLNVYPENTIPVFPSPSPSPNIPTCSVDDDAINPIYPIQSPGLNTCTATYSTYEAFDMSLEAYDYVISKEILIDYLIATVIDNSDGQIGLTDDSIIIRDQLDNQYQYIVEQGFYYIYFNISDLMGNFVDENIYVKIQIIE